MLGRSENSEIKKIYRRLIQLSEDGIALCPLSEDIFHEIIKQEDRYTLEASLKLIDNLSSGVSILSLNERLKIEILHFMERYSPESNIPKLDNLVWTKLAYTVGTYVPTNKIFGEEEGVIQKSFIDQLWTMSIFEIYSMWIML